MNRSFRIACVALLAACHSSPPQTPADPVALEPLRPLAQLAGQRVIITPAFALVTVDALGWGASIPRSRDYLRQLDDEIAKEFAERGLKTRWTYPADLVAASKRNPTYAVDPYLLGAAVLRNPNLRSGDKVGDPLVTQLRTMVAIQEDARAVLMPVEVRFEKLPTGQGVASLRVALMDGRLGDIRWIGTVKSAPSDSLSRAMLASLAAHLADLVTQQ